MANNNETERSIKAFDLGGLLAVISAIKQAQSTSENIGQNLAALAETVNAVLTEIGGAITELDSTKAYIAVTKSFTLAVNSWAEDTAGSADYPYKYELTLTGATIDTRADIIFDHSSAFAAGDCGMSSVSETAANKVILRSAQKPSVALTGTLYLTRAATPQNESNGSNEEE